MKLALAQISAKENDRRANLEAQVGAIEEAARQGAELVLFPELFDIGYSQPRGDVAAWRVQAIAPDDPYIAALRDVYRRCGVWGVITFLERGREAPRNSVMVVDKLGREVCRYAKIHLYEPGENDAACEPGERFITFDFPAHDGPARIGLMICADRDFPESARVLMKMGAELIIAPNACRLNNFLSDILRVRAIENAVCLAVANYPAPAEDGHSAVIDKGGEFLCRLGEQPEIRTLDIPLQQLKAYRAGTNWWGDTFRKEYAYARILDGETPAAFAGRTNAIGVRRVRGGRGAGGLP